MDYTSIHIYGHFLSDDILHAVERDYTLLGNREQDFGLDSPVQSTIDYVWSSLRNDWRYFNERSMVNDPYGTRRSRDLMERFLTSLGYRLTRQLSNIVINGVGHDITYLCKELKDMPVIVVGDKTGDADVDTLDKSSLDFRAKGAQRKKSPHATMLEYLNNTENVYGIVSNGKTLRIIRNTGQLVKLTYIEFDLQRMLEEDKYTEFCLMFRLLHSTRFRVSGDEQCVMERYFNMSIESGNRIRDGLSLAVQRAMETIGVAAVQGGGAGNDALRAAIMEGRLSPERFNKELIHFIYRLLFLFIIEERNLVYQIPPQEDPNYKKLCNLQDIYRRFYAASRLRQKSELAYLRQKNYHDLWDGLMDTFRLFENEAFGEPLGIKPLGGVLFNSETLKYLKHCTISNATLMEAFSALNEFKDERQQLVKINYSSLDVEEFGSVYEGILEMRPYVNQGMAATAWEFGYVGGLDRKSTSSYYTRPDLVQSLIKTTLVPVIEKILQEHATTEEKIKALLNMKVCDGASGSGHIVLAMARTIAWYVCTLRTGEDNPASLDYREALREVIQKCVYAVDYNPDAVELCKVVLWIEGYCAGKPLSFLDHHIRCGNSVVGITNLDVLLEGVPWKAFSAENTDVFHMVKNKNQQAIDEAIKRFKGQQYHPSLFDDDFEIQRIDKEQIGLASKVKEISELPENSLLEELTKQKRWEELMASPRVECLQRACDIYTYAFYHQFKAEELQQVNETSHKLPEIPYTRTVFHALEEIKHLEKSDSNFTPLTETFKKHIAEVASHYRFFHWCIEFPEVFAGNGGFDVMCGNPPWDKIKVEDKKWFENHGRSDIVNAGTAAQRKEVIENLPQTDPKLYEEYVQSQSDAEALSRFLRFSDRFPLTATGDIDLYPLFAEHCLHCSKEAWGLVLPTGIVTNDTNKVFFSKLIEENRLMSLYSFENEEKLFQIAHNFKFCLLTAGKASSIPVEVKGGFYLRRLEHILDPNRIYTLNTEDFNLINPNAKTCPVFRTSKDAQLTSKIYHNSIITTNQITGENLWKIKTGAMLHMSGDSSIFRTYKQLNEAKAKFHKGFFTTIDGCLYVPLYEGKMIWFYNHHYGTWPIEGIRPKAIPSPSLDNWKNVNEYILPWFWVPATAVKNKLIKTDNNKVIWEWKHNWTIGFRDVCSSTLERTFTVSLIPDSCGAGHTINMIYPDQNMKMICVLQSMMSSLVFDYVAKQKIGGNHATVGLFKQMPLVNPNRIIEADIMAIVKRNVELNYFNHDLDGWAEELWNEMTPEQQAELPELGRKECFIYDPDKRAVWQAELDAIFAHLYGLTTEELKYILDPEDVCGKGCINETFRVLKENELREFGEYRTKRLVMTAWNRFGYDN